MVELSPIIHELAIGTSMRHARIWGTNICESLQQTALGQLVYGRHKDRCVQAPFTFVGFTACIPENLPDRGPRPWASSYINMGNGRTVSQQGAACCCCSSCRSFCRSRRFAAVLMRVTHSHMHAYTHASIHAWDDCVHAYRRTDFWAT